MTTTKLLQQLISIPSWVGADNDEANIADACLTLLSPLRPTWDIIEQPVSGQRRNILLSNSDAPEVLFTSHLDTVPPSDEWLRDPFTPTIINDRLYGLGAVDMKAGLACLLKALITYGASSRRPSAALFYVGEEYDFCGMRAFLAQSPLRPQLVINPEPTDRRVLRGCRGVLECNFTVQGRAAHAAKPDQGINAITAGINAVRDLQRQLAAAPSTPLDRSTVNLAWVEGGLSLNGKIIARPNIVPATAKFVVEIRTATLGVTSEYVTERLRRSLEQQNARLVNLEFPLDVGPMPVRPDKTLPTAFDNWPTGDMATTGYFDTQMIAEARGSASLVCGPGPRDMAHQADEYVNLSDLEALEAAITDILQK